jgi:hypothetical protein
MRQRAARRVVSCGLSRRMRVRPRHTCTGTGRVFTSMARCGGSHRYTAAAGLGAPVRICVSQRDGEEARIDMDQRSAFFSRRSWGGCLAWPESRGGGERMRRHTDRTRIMTGVGPDIRLGVVPRRLVRRYDGHLLRRDRPALACHPAGGALRADDTTRPGVRADSGPIRG